MKKEHVLFLKPEKWVHKGYTIAHSQGIPVFCTGGVPGQEAEFIVEKRTKNHMFARIAHVDSDCKVFPECGGCSYRHISYEEELKIKLNELKEALRSVMEKPNLLENTKIVYGNPIHYRNNVQWKRTQDGLGFYKRFSNEVVSLKGIQCKNLNPHLPFDPKDPHFPLEWRMSSLDQNTAVPVAYKNSETQFYWNGKTFLIPPNGFMQVNTEMMVRWLEEIHSIFSTVFQFYGKVDVVELFCGSGILGQSLDSLIQYLKGYEVSESSVQYARKNAKNHSLSHFYYEKKDLYKEKLQYKPRKDPWFLILNPPRAGAGNGVVEWISETQPEGILYSSCDVHTLARDIKRIFSRNPSWVIQKVLLLDFFPRTSHFETLVYIAKKSSQFSMNF